MISVSDISSLYEHMSNIIAYGVYKEYSYNVIEDRISFSDMFRRLENSDSSFLRERTMHQEIELIYSQSVDIDLFNNKDSLFYWLGQAYIRIFFKFHKSLYYIFLYFPLKEMMDAYHIYHEMDWSELYNFFLEKIKSNTLLEMLLKRRGLSINKLSALAGISINTIKYYYKDDEHLFEAKFAFIDQLAFALKVNSNVFLKEIHNYINSGEYEYDRRNPLYRSYLGLYLVSYYSSTIKNRKYVLDKNTHAFVSGNKILKVLCTQSIKFIEPTNEANQQIVDMVDVVSNMMFVGRQKDTILVIFEFNEISESVKPYLGLLKYGYENIYIINQTNILCIGDNYWTSYIPESVFESMIENAKKAIGNDFAI